MCFCSHVKFPKFLFDNYKFVVYCQILKKVFDIKFQRNTSIWSEVHVFRKTDTPDKGKWALFSKHLTCQVVLKNPLR